MKNEGSWVPSKYAVGADGLTALPDAPLRSRRAIEVVGRYVGLAIAAHARGRLLDLGCGMAPFYAAYRPLVDEIICVDWSGSAYAADHVDVEHDLNQPLPFDDRRFDTILLSDVLEHLPEPEALWREMSRILEAGGKVIMNTPFLYWQHEMPHDYYRYTETALRRFAERAGLEVVELAPIGGPLDVIADLASKEFERRRFGRPLALTLQALARRRRQPRKTPMPLGFGMVAMKP